MGRFLLLFPQRPATMTEVRRRPTGRWRTPRRWSSQSALPGPPSWGPSSPLSSTSSHQLKTVLDQNHHRPVPSPGPQSVLGPLVRLPL